MAARRSSVIRIVLAWAMLTLAWCAFVVVLAGRLHAQEVGCHQIDRFGFPCIPGTGEIFVEQAHQKLASNEWIDRSSNKKGERCCDAGKDCHSLAPERVVPAEGGVNVTMDDGRTLFIPGQEIMPSEDGKYWLCYWGGRARCFFAPYSGS